MYYVVFLDSPTTCNMDFSLQILGICTVTCRFLQLQGGTVKTLTRDRLSCLVTGPDSPFWPTNGPCLEVIISGPENIEPMQLWLRIGQQASYVLCSSVQQPKWPDVIIHCRNANFQMRSYEDWNPTFWKQNNSEFYVILCRQESKKEIRKLTLATSVTFCMHTKDTSAIIFFLQL